MLSQKRNRRRRTPAIWAGVYMSVLLLLFRYGVTQDHADPASGGIGFLPLLVLTTPWSWLLLLFYDQIGISNSAYWGKGWHLLLFVTCNILSGTANCYILYIILMRRKNRETEDDGDPDTGVGK